MGSNINKIYYTLNEGKNDIAELYEKGITRGVYMGFETLHEYFSFKSVGTTYIYGSPFSGKSEWWFEIMITLTELYGYRHAIYSPESGNRHEIYAELISKYLGKQFYKNMDGHMSEIERMKAEDFIHEYFYVIDPDDKDLTIEQFYLSIADLEKKLDKKINTTLCDPFNELFHQFDTRQDLYIESRLGFIRREAFTNNRHNVIITHCTDQEATLDKGTNKRYYAPPSPREIAGGQAWYRKAMNLICLWRPPEWMIDPLTGAPHHENEVHIIIHKYKPKGVGKKGTVKLYYDTIKNRYYELIDGNKRYAGHQGTKNPYATQLDF